MKVVLDHLFMRFPSSKKGGEETVAVNDFNFEIPDGRLVGLLGPSGCGKSTTLNLICGLLTPSSGRIFFGDEDVTALPPEHRGVGLVFQNYALYPHLTVKKNIMFPLENLKGDKKMTRQQMEEKTLEAARLVQIDEYMDRKPSELSGGQQQRVAIARALVKRPGVLLLDEPLSNLDARLRLQTREEIRRIQKETGITTIFVTHDQEEAMSITDMIVVMENGIIRQIGKPQEVYDDPRNLFVARFLGTPAINVFSGEIRGGALYAADDRIMEGLASIADQSVSVAVRPEGLVPSEEGVLSADIVSTEVMGRDCSIVFTHPSSDSPALRAIVGSELLPKEGERKIRFSIRSSKIFIFDGNGERIRTGE